MHTVELTPAAVESLVVEDLKWSLTLIDDDSALEGALHTVIAWYSVPGEYLEGAYDS